MKSSPCQPGRQLLGQVRLPLALSLALALLFGAAGAASAQESWVATHTQAAIVQGNQALLRTASHSSDNHWTLRLNHSPQLDASAVGDLAADKSLHVQVGLNLRNVEALETLLREQQDPSSANYHQYLTSAEFKARFAPSDAQVQAVVAHLQKYGFSHIQTAGNNLLVEADAPAGQVASAFHTHFKAFSYQGRDSFANAAPAEVPQALADLVDGVFGLQNINRVHTFHHILPQRQVAAAGTDASGVSGHVPTDFASIYGATALPTAAATPVGIVVWGDVTQTIQDLNSFTAKHGLPPTKVQVVKTSAGTYTDDPNGDSEWNLDSQTIVGTSGGVDRLVFYSSPEASDTGILAAYNRIVADDAVKVINLSFGEDETDAHDSGIQAADDRAFAQAAAQGQVFSASSGDAGVYGWSSDPLSGQPGYVANATGEVRIDLAHYSVEEPSSSPYVVSVGGTLLATSGNTGWAGESTWNQGLSAIRPPFDWNQALGATGGGISDFEAAPSWQAQLLGVSKRHLPDVAFDADPSSGALILQQGRVQQIGGTSLASPIFVGLWARIESAHGNKLGLPGSQFYTLFPQQPALVHDVTAGNNGYDGYGYKAGVGYDTTTGWGSFNTAAVSAALK